MIRLKNIEMEENRITCNAFIESYTEGVPLVYDIKAGDFQPYAIPEYMGHCRTHIGMARRFFEKTLQKGETLPTERLIMWY